MYRQTDAKNALNYLEICVHIPGSSACLYIACIINKVYTEFDHLMSLFIYIKALKVFFTLSVL